jgi:hypothetical protein
LSNPISAAQSTSRLAEHSQNVVQRIAVAVHVEHRGKSRYATGRRSALGSLTAEQPTEQTAEPTAR